MVTNSVIQGAIQRIADQRIREAMDAGLFDNLPLEGKPLPPMEPEVPGMEMVAWVRDWIRRESLRSSDLRRQA